MKWLNDQHWWIIAGVITVGIIFTAYGCYSEVESLITPGKLVGRAEIETELRYLIGIAETRIADLDKQDEIKQALYDSTLLVATTGTVNPAGLINIAATIGAIAFGLNRNQKFKALKNS